MYEESPRMEENAQRKTVEANTVDVHVSKCEHCYYITVLYALHMLAKQRNMIRW
jgi:hypothetical protein